MISRRKIRRALRAVLLSGVPSLPDDARLAWENVSFAPPNPPKLWVRENINWGEEVKSATALLELVGIVQYDVFDRVGNSTEDAEELAEEIGTAFEPGTIVNHGGVHCTVVRADTNKGMESSVGEQTWYQVPVVVAFRAFGYLDE